MTKTEAEILPLITEEFLTAGQIALSRQVTRRAVEKIIKRLKEKGFLTISSQNVRRGGGTMFASEHFENQIRLHAEQWQLTPIIKSEKYQKSIGKQINIDGNTILIHRDSIDVYSNTSFFGNSTIEATEKSMNYWNFIWIKIEHILSVIIIKPLAQNKQRVKAEYAHIQNGLATKCLNESEKIRIKDKDDGKSWFVIDNSFNLKEAETTHPQTSQKDMQSVVEPFFNDLRDKENFKPSETKEFIQGLVKATANLTDTSQSYKPMFSEMNQNLLRFANAMEFYGKHFESHAGLIKEGTSLLKKINKKEKQKKLGDY